MSPVFKPELSMSHYKLTFLISILILTLLSACGADGMEPSVPTYTSVASTSVAAPPLPTLLYFWAQW